MAKKLWSIPHDHYSAVGLGVGDPDDDGEREVVWGSGNSGGRGGSALMVGSPSTLAVEWHSDNSDGPYFTASGDVDHDGQGEIVVSSTGANDGYGGGTIYVYDAVTHALEWSVSQTNHIGETRQLGVAQLDSDPALEIIAGDYLFTAYSRLWIYDGSSQALEYDTQDFLTGWPAAFVTAELDQDGIDELVVGLTDGRVKVLHGATATVQWESGSLGMNIIDLDTGDLDGDGVIELAVLANTGVYIFSTASWAQEKFIPAGVQFGVKVVIANEDQAGPGELLLLTGDGYPGNAALQALNGVTYQQLWQRAFTGIYIRNLEAVDLDADGVQEIILSGGYKADFGNSGASYLAIGCHHYPLFWEYEMSGQRWGMIQDTHVADVDGDGQLEFMFGSSSAAQLSEITHRIITSQRTFLPAVTKPHPPRGIHGFVTKNGAPAGGIGVELRWLNGHTGPS
jgi:hypothetical protein